jgi:hypothetical protein
MNKSPDEELTDILLDLGSQCDMSPSDIDQAIQRYPLHREAILQFAADWSVAGLGVVDGESFEALPAPDLSRLHSVQVSVFDPFEKKTSSELKALATNCDVPVSILAKLSERLVNVTTVPMLLIGQLAGGLQTSVSELIQFLDQDPLLGASDYRSDQPPTVGDKIDFSAAIRSTTMSDSQRQKWLSLSE